MGDDDGRKIVWVLGAGFSRSLGAPLLADLFTAESLRRAKHRYDGIAALTGADRVVKICQDGTYGLPHSKPVERQWAHAEEFLERLDLAQTDPVEADNLEGFAKKIGSQLQASMVGNLQLSALELLAAEICGFLEKRARIHTVLGDDINSTDSRRLKGMLACSLRWRRGHQAMAHVGRGLPRLGNPEPALTIAARRFCRVASSALH